MMDTDVILLWSSYLLTECYVVNRIAHNLDHTHKEKCNIQKDFNVSCE